MDYISRINGFPLSEVSESQTEIQQQNTSATGAPSAENAPAPDEIVPFDPNPFENLLGLSSAIQSPLDQVSASDTQFNSSGAATGSTTVGQVNTKSGGGSIQGQTDIAGHAIYDVAIDLDKGTAKANVDVGASTDSHYEAEYKDSTNIDGHDVGIDAKVAVDLHGAAEGKGSAVVQVNDSGARVDLEGEAFAGAQGGIEGDASASIDGTEMGSVKGGLEGWLGVGVEGGISAGYKNGVFSFSASAGAALGAGGKASLGFSINFGAIGRAAENLAKDVVDDLSEAAGAVASKLGEIAGAAADAFSAAARAIGGAAGDVAGAIVGAAGDVAEAIGKGVEAVGDFFSSIFGGSSSDSSQQTSSTGETDGIEKSQEETEGTVDPEKTDSTDDDAKAENTDDTTNDDDSPIDPHDGEDGLPADDGSGGGVGPTWLNSMQETSGATDPDSGNAGNDTGGGGISIGSQSTFGSSAAKAGASTGITNPASNYQVGWEDGGYVMPNADPYEDGYQVHVNPGTSAASVALNGSLMSAFNAVFAAPDAAKTAQAESNATN